MDWYILVLKKYADFNGRARRKEYWMFALFNCLIAFAVTGTFFGASALLGEKSDLAAMAMIPLFLYCFAMLIPSLAVTVRRLHDTGRSGWWYLISFVPFVGGIILFVFTVFDGDPRPNLYGPDPKDPAGFYPVPPIPQSW